MLQLLWTAIGYLSCNDSLINYLWREKNTLFHPFISYLPLFSDESLRFMLCSRPLYVPTPQVTAAELGYVLSQGLILERVTLGNCGITPEVVFPTMLRALCLLFSVVAGSFLFPSSKQKVWLGSRGVSFHWAICCSAGAWGVCWGRTQFLRLVPYATAIQRYGSETKKRKKEKNTEKERERERESRGSLGFFIDLSEEQKCSVQCVQAA